MKPKFLLSKSLIKVPDCWVIVVRYDPTLLDVAHQASNLAMIIVLIVILV